MGHPVPAVVTVVGGQLGTLLAGTVVVADGGVTIA